MAIALDLEGTLAARKYAEDADRYSLTGPGFDSFNVSSIAPAEERISDGLGHWWDSSTQQWMNDSGGAYNAQQSYAQPQDDYFGNFDQYAPENMGTQAYAPPDNYSLSGPGFDQFNVANPPYSLTGPQFDYFNAATTDPLEPSYETVNGKAQYGMPVQGGNTSTWDWVNGRMGAANDEFFDPIAETGAQLTPLFNMAGAPSSVLTGKALSGLGYGQDPTDSMEGGLRELGSAIKDSGGDIRQFSNIQNENFDERPLYQQLPAGALYDPTNVLGVGALKKVGLLDDAADLFRSSSYADDALRAADGLKIPSIYDDSRRIIPQLGQEAQYPAFARDLTIPQGRAIPVLGGGADETPTFNYDDIWRRRDAGEITPEQAMNEFSAMSNAEMRASDARRAAEKAAEPTFKKATADDAINNYAEGRISPDFRVVDPKTGEKIGTIKKYPSGYQAFDRAGNSVGDGFRSRLDAAKQLQATPVAERTVNDSRRKLLDALDAERRFRTSGQADEIISQGRRTQAEGIATATGDLSGSFADDAARIAAGARTGPMLAPTAGLGLDDATMGSLLKEAVDFNGGNQFDNIQAMKALDKLNQGVRLQPAEIKALGRIYGDEVAQAVAATNPGRIQTIAELTPDDIAKINRLSEIDGKRVATLEVQAQRQHELADDLVRQERMDPTNPRLKKAAEDARARALKQQNDADRILAERAERATAGLPERGETQILRGEEARTGTVKQAEKADRAALRAENKARLDTDEQVVNRARDVVAKLDVSDNLKTQLLDTIDLGLRKNRAILDGMGEDAPGILRRIYAATTGEVTDSYTSKLLTQRALVQNALENQGLTKETAKKIAKLLQEAELRGRYGDNIPQHVLDSLEQAKFDFQEGGAIRGLADLSQELKNTQFGIGDLAVFGQQGAKAVATNAPQIMTGLVNRLLNVMHLGVDTGMAESGLGKDIVYQLDGLAKTSHAITDLTNERTLVSRLGPAGKFIDSKAVVPATKWLTDLQFQTILGNLRKIVYEGNLVMAKGAGADISDAAVRLKAAEWANAATGAGKLAQRSGRANAEKAFLLSPSMRRAQVQQIGQVARGLTGGTRVDRILAASTIVSAVGSTLAVGKLLNDWIGVGDFEMDPSKKGFGNITLPGGTVINPFSQEQVAKALLRSVRVLAEDGVTAADAKAIAEEWGKLLVSSASPGVRPILASVGVGIDDTGYHWGDLGAGQSFGQRLLNAAPIPPLAQSIVRNGVDAVRTPLEAIGVNAYPESGYDVLDRNVRGDATFEQYRIDSSKPVSMSNLSPRGKQLAQEKYGKLEPFGPEGEASAAVVQKLTTEQQAADTRLQSGELTFEQWHDIYQGKKDELSIRNDQIYSKLNLKSKDPILGSFYDAIQKAERPDGTVDWDKVDKYRATLDATANKYIDDNTGLLKIDTPQTRLYEKNADTIRESGYWDASDIVVSAWAQKTGLDVGDQSPNQFFSDLRVQMFDYFKQQGADDFQAQLLTTQTVNKIRSPYDEAVGKVRKAMREADPTLMRALVEAGYYQPGKEATAKILAGAE